MGSESAHQDVFRRTVAGPVAPWSPVLLLLLLVVVVVVVAAVGRIVCIA